MIRTASYAPHLGAALGAGLMLAAALAYNAGAQNPLSGEEPTQADAIAWPERIRARSDGVHLTPQAVQTDVGDNEDQHLHVPRGEPGPFYDDHDQALDAIEERPRLVVIIDDIGLDLDIARQLIALDAPITLSILPYAEAAPHLARQAQQAGRDVFVHLPMEPVGVEDPGPYAITSDMAGEAVSVRLNWAFSRVPGAVGFNNHMGSRITADRAAMEGVFAAYEFPQSLIFVDSVTHPRSQAFSVAQNTGLQAFSRDIFLDHDPSQEAVSAQLNAALALALQNGQAIAIGHPRPQTVRVLEELSARAEAVGVEIVGVSALTSGAVH